jgi:uncharacterized membrane protein
VHLLSILALALEWILFGLCHFLFQTAAEAEIPPWILRWTHLGKTFIILVTGVIEVATGILILFPQTRNIAAISSLVLLFLFLPSIYHMLISDAAFPESLQAWRNYVRVLLVPNHVFLALCALYLWRVPESLPR